MVALVDGSLMKDGEVACLDEHHSLGIAMNTVCAIRQGSLCQKVQISSILQAVWQVCADIRA